ncbi:MAG TPA: DUF3160 domain-containing protein [Polyangia bacterium]
MSSLTVEELPLQPRNDKTSFLPVAELFDAELAKAPRLSRDALFAQLKLDGTIDRPPPPLSFDPTTVRHYSTIESKLKLTDEERALYRENGVVGVDHGQRYSMASAYYAIYARDLPLLITTDSVLHALHRSYDAMLMEIELGIISPLISEVLEGVHGALERRRSTFAGALLTSAKDLDIYISVARSLLGGAGAGAESTASTRREEKTVTVIEGAPVKPVGPKLASQSEVDQLLSLVSSQKMQFPDRDPPTRLRGANRYVDYSQFIPRGHYTESEFLKRYFRTVMWLGRSDLGFVLNGRATAKALNPDVERERRAAALLTLILRDTGGDKRLEAISQILDFFVGRSDGITVDQMAAALERTKNTAPHRLTAEALERLQRDLAASTPAKQIRSQVLMGTEELPQLFQMLGQRFVLDSFVLANLVHPKIELAPLEPKRSMPTGLDVMAALGNDEAVRLLGPQLDTYKYSGNLLAARRVVDAHQPDHWAQNLYTLWLDTLRALDDEPPAPAHFPETMRRTPWRRKQLQAQLASWAELRHDTILYAEQSYTAGIECEYPEGIVEPYPEVYRRLRFFAIEGARLLGNFTREFADRKTTEWSGRMRARHVQFLGGFASIMERLERMARKQLAAQPFSAEERTFLKQAIDQRGAGSGPPTYSGWYTTLIYEDGPADWEPTVADVHTDPNTEQVLEVAVGDVNFIVVAIDNQGDRAAYVGPIYSYYEFHQKASQRLTDEQWRASIQEGKIPPRPAWTKPFQPAAKRRSL